MKHKSFLFLILFFALVTSLSAQTQVSGVIEGETWTKSGSPYLVIDNITVLQLTIEPGVSVRFTGNYSFQIDGTMKAVGTRSDSIIFESDASNTQGWQGLIFNSTASKNCQMNFVRISDASASAALTLQDCNLNFEGLTIRDNDGTGIKIKNGSLTLTHSDIFGNGYGVEVNYGGSIECIACNIVRNTDTGIETSDGTVTLTNSIVAHNASEGILLSASGDALTATNSVIAYNQKEGIIATNGTLNVKNSIVFFNQALNQIANISGSTTVTYSDVNQPDLGSTNINTDPLFSDTESFELSANSPAIDQGDPDPDYADKYFPPSKGTARNDMGAYGGPYARKWFSPLFVQPDSLHFGDVSMGDSLTKEVVIKNYGDTQLSVQDITLGGSDQSQFSLPQLNFPISINMADSLRLPVRFHPNSAQIAPFEAGIHIQSNFGDDDVALDGRGVVPDIFILPDRLNFDPVAVGSQDSLEVKIFNLGTDTLKIDSLYTSSPVFQFSLTGTQLPPSSNAPLMLTVYFKPDSIDSYQDSLTIISNDPDESPAEVALSGQGMAPVAALNASLLSFDSVQVFTDSTRFITLNNPGNADLEIQSIHVLQENSAFHVELTAPITIVPYDSLRIPIRFRPDTALVFTDTLRIESNDPFHPEQAIPLTGAGVAPYIQLSQSTVDFGTILAPNDSTVKLKIRNSGNIPLQIRRIDLIGPDTSSFHWWKAADDLTVNPENDSLTVYLRCNPQKSGLLQTTLNIVSNDVRFDSLQIPVTARVMASELGIEPDTVRFADVILFEKSHQEIKIFNRGNYVLHIDSILIKELNGQDLVFPSLNFPLTIRPNIDTLTYTIGFSPQKAGLQSATIAIYSNDPFVNPRMLTIEAEAVEPKLSVRPDTLDFGAISVFRKGIKEISIKNVGTAPVAIDTVTIENDTANAFGLPRFYDTIFLMTDQDSSRFPVYFNPPHKGNFSAQLTIHWNNPYGKDTHIFLTGQADSAFLSAPSRLDFGKHIIHSQSDGNILLKNRSKVNVVVDSLKISGKDRSQFMLQSDSLNVKLTPGDTLFPISVRYEPHQTGLHSAQLLIYSRDIKEKVLSVNLHGIALLSGSSPLLISNLNDSLNFGAVFVDEMQTYPCLLTNLGNAALRIDSVTISGQNAADFSLNDTFSGATIAVNDTLKNIVLQFTPNAEGVRRAELDIYSSDPQANPERIFLNGQGKIDETPAHVELQLDTLTITAGNDASLKILAQDDSTHIQKAEIYFREGGKSEFNVQPMTFLGNGLWKAKLNAQYIGARGVNVYFKFYHGGNVTTYPSQGPAKPLSISVTVPQAAFPQFTLKGKYQMISVPFISGNQTLSDLFDDDLGAYDPGKYRLFDWDATQKEFKELSDLQTKLTPGKAIYLISSDSLQLDVNNVQTVPTNEAFTISLAAGWNMIGNPFAFPVNWNEVEKGNENLSLYYYNGYGWQTAQQLTPFKGYAVYAPKALTLSIPPREASPAIKKPTVSDSTSGWRFQVIASCGKYFDALNYFGVRSQEQGESESYEIPELPVIGKYVSLYFNRPEQSDRSNHWSSDFRPIGENGYSFDFQITTNLNKPIVVQFAHDSLPSGWSWCVVSPRTGVKYSELPIKLNTSGQTLRVIVGTTAYLKKELEPFQSVPGQFRLHQNFPNPFNSSTVIKLDLPTADILSLIIFDINGRKVRTLVNRHPYEPGYYQFKWDGKAQNGLPVASGIYFVHVQSKNFEASKKIILQK